MAESKVRWPFEPRSLGLHTDAISYLFMSPIVSAAFVPQLLQKNPEVRTSSAVLETPSYVTFVPWSPLHSVELPLSEQGLLKQEVVISAASGQYLIVLLTCSSWGRFHDLGVAGCWYSQVRGGKITSLATDLSAFSLFEMLHSYRLHTAAYHHELQQPGRSTDVTEISTRTSKVQVRHSSRSPTGIPKPAV